MIVPMWNLTPETPAAPTADEHARLLTLMHERMLTQTSRPPVYIGSRAELAILFPPPVKP